MKRKRAIEIVKGLPREFNVEMLLEKMIFVEKVDQGLKVLSEGLTVPHGQAKEMIKKW